MFAYLINFLVCISSSSPQSSPPYKDASYSTEALLPGSRHSPYMDGLLPLLGFWPLFRVIFHSLYPTLGTELLLLVEAFLIQPEPQQSHWAAFIYGTLLGFLYPTLGHPLLHFKECVAALSVGLTDLQGYQCKRRQPSSCALKSITAVALRTFIHQHHPLLHLEKPIKC